MDERGYVDITDRKKDMFISGGFNAYPAEIETTLLEHPAIAQAAVVGMPDDRLGEVGLRLRHPPHGDRRRPRRGHRVEQRADGELQVPAARRSSSTTFPRNAIGKVLKYELREALQLE